MPDVSIIFVEQDRDYVASLAKLFERRRWSVWWDRNRIVSSGPVEWEKATVVILVWSKNSLTSRTLSYWARVVHPRKLVEVGLDDVTPPATIIIPLERSLAPHLNGEEKLNPLLERLEQIIGEEARQVQAEKEREEARQREIKRLERVAQVLLSERSAALVRPVTLPPSDFSKDRVLLRNLWERIEEEAWREESTSANMSEEAYHHLNEKIGGEVPKRRTRVPPEFVDVSAFGPQSARAGEQVLVQVLVHRPAEATVAAAFGREIDPGAQRRGVVSLTSEIRFKQRIDITLDAPGLIVKMPSRFLIWHGRTTACQFLVDVPGSTDKPVHHIRVQVSIDSIPVGFLIFALSISDVPVDLKAKSEIRGDSARRYRYAFLSYTKSDRAEVLKRAQILRALHISFFHDLLSIDPGEKWRPRLYEEIDRCDLFLLFWSSEAAKSEWVLYEAQYAMKKRQESAEELPDIRPIILELPVPEAPEFLDDIHFNDALQYMISGVEVERALTE